MRETEMLATSGSGVFHLTKPQESWDPCYHEDWVLVLCFSEIVMKKSLDLKEKVPTVFLRKTYVNYFRSQVIPGMESSN